VSDYTRTPNFLPLTGGSVATTFLYVSSCAGTPTGNPAVAAA
jgi:hypothetical protein